MSKVKSVVPLRFTNSFTNSALQSLQTVQMPSSTAEDIFDVLEIDEDAALAALEAAENAYSHNELTAGPSRSRSRNGSVEEVERFSDGEVIVLREEEGDKIDGAPGGFKRPGDLSAGRSASANLSKWKQRDLQGNPIALTNAVQSLSSRASSSTSRVSSSKAWDDDEIERSNALRRRRMAGYMDDEESDDHHDSYGGVQVQKAKVEKLPASSNPFVAVDEEAAKTWIYPTNMPRRDYQFNIVQKALLDNVLVALPTGLGKTFIAAVVILNYFRWFPRGKSECPASRTPAVAKGFPVDVPPCLKVIFVAPTRPLVAQQQRACHGICGLPWDTAIELTGSTKVSLRGDEWESKRIFYMTPQTLENDLLSTNCDARQVVCLVVDEAHRATGNFAYCNVVRHLMRQNRNFRILALTATPGSTSSRVQEVVDNLHIGDVQMRSEDAMDIRPYVHQKKEHIVTADFDEDMRQLVEAWKDLMQHYLAPLVRAGIIHQPNPLRLHPYAAQGKMNELKRDPSKRQHLGNLNALAALARSRVHLVEYSIEMFRSSAGLGVDNSKIKGKVQSKSAAIKGDSMGKITKILKRMQESASRSSIPHPKMRKLFETIHDHFLDHTTDETLLQEAHYKSTQGRAGVPAASMRQTRAIVFCSFRDCVNEIVKYLNEEGDMYNIRATHFIGQANTKSGKGLRQKDQETVINKFKSGEFNVIVSTSIGEEGLDIGDVDLIVNYDSVKDSVRSLQRVGRTGRKRDGKIVILCAEGGMEAEGWKQAKESYKDVQQQIHSDFGSGIQTYSDISRMLPKGVSPTVLFQDVEQPEFDPDMIVKSGAKKGDVKTKVKRKTLKEAMTDPPKGSILGFVTASKYEKLSGIDEEGGSDENSLLNAAAVEVKVRGKGKSTSKARGKGKKAPVPDKVFSDETDSESDDLAPHFKARRAPAALPHMSRAVRKAFELEDDSDDAEVLSPIDQRCTFAKVSKRKIPARSASTLTDRNRSTKGSSEAPIILSDNEDSAAAITIKAGRSFTGRSIPSPHLPEIAVSSSDFDISWECNSDEMEQVMLAAEARQKERAVAEQQRGQHIGRSSPELHRVDSSPIERSGPAATRSDVEDSPLGRLKRGPPAPQIARLMAELDAAKAVKKATKKSPASSAARKKMAKAVEDASAEGKSKAQTDSDISNDDHLFDHMDDELFFAIPTAPMRAPGLRTPVRRDVIQTPARHALPLDTTFDPEADSSSSRIYVRPRNRLAVTTDASSSPIAGPLRVRVAAPAPALCSSPLEDGLMLAPVVLPRVLKRKSVRASEETHTKKAKGSAKRPAKDRRKKQKKRIGNSPTSRLLFVDQADRSTDEDRHGELDEDDEGLDTDEENEEDRRAVGHFAPTQGPKGYDQQSIYSRSLFTQMLPTPFRPIQRGGFPGVGGHFGLQESPVGGGKRRTAAAAAMSSNHRRGASNDTSRYGPNGTPDRYSQDSFCAADDEEIEYETGTGGTRSSQL